LKSGIVRGSKVFCLLAKLPYSVLQLRYFATLKLRYLLYGPLGLVKVSCILMAGSLVVRFGGEIFISLDVRLSVGLVMVTPVPSALDVPAILPLQPERLRPKAVVSISLYSDEFFMIDRFTINVRHKKGHGY